MEVEVRPDTIPTNNLNESLTLIITPKPSKNNEDAQNFVSKLLGFEPSQFILHEDHLKEKISEESVLPSDLPPSNTIMDIFKATEIKAEDLTLWANYSGFQMFSDKSNMASPLQSIVDYCESSDKTSEGLKQKFRFVNEKIQKKEVDAVGLLILLAAHGGMCNVQKEVGVRMAFSFVTNSVKNEIEKQSLPHHVKKILANYREQLTEKTFVALNPKLEKNSHNIIPFRNELAPKIGLDLIPDPQPFLTSKFDQKWLDKFFEYYSPISIASLIHQAVNDEPRKIPYEPFVEYLKGSFPENMDAYEILTECFDSKGKIAIGVVLHLLQHMNILTDKAQSDTPKPKEETLVVQSK